MFRRLAKLVCIPTSLRRRSSIQRAGSTEAPNLELSGAAVPLSAAAPIIPESHFPRLPPDLVLLILNDIWDAPQTAQERSAFIKNTTLVNRTWLVLVAYITSRDVHIHTSEDAMIFTQRLSKEPGEVADLFTAEKMRVTNAICRSVTFHIDGTLAYTCSGAVVPGPIPHPDPSWPPPARHMHDAIEIFLLALGMPGDRHWEARLPQLRHIALRYTDWAEAYDDTFRHLELGPFPPQVARLSIHHAFPDAGFRDAACERWLSTRRGADARYAPPAFLCGKRRCDAGHTIEWWEMGNVRHLALSGATTAPFVVAALRACYGVETLELELEFASTSGEGEPAAGPGGVRLEALAPLPPAVRTVVLRHPSPVDSDGEQQMWPWGKLCEALRNLNGPGLFPQVTVPRATTSTGSCGTRRGDSNATRTRLRTVVRCAGTPDLSVFESARRECERFGVELVHEPDGC